MGVLLPCQWAKVHRHVTMRLCTFAMPDARFNHIHINLVGPLPPSNGCIYLLICSPHSANTVVQALIQTWVSRLDVPSTITTDRGGQFESHLWRALELLGTKHTRTTAYHPIANGMVKRFHRQLKSSLKASPHSERWTDMLHLALLGIRRRI